MTKMQKTQPIANPKKNRSRTCVCCGRKIDNGYRWYCTACDEKYWAKAEGR